MTELLGLDERDLRELAAALRTGRLAPPFAAVSVRRIVPRSSADGLAQRLRQFGDDGFTPAQIAATLELIRADRARRPSVDEAVQLVITGPEVEGSESRDTAAVVASLFAGATRRVLVAGYAVYQGQRVFQALADRMVERAGLDVRLFLDVQRGHGDSTTSAELIRRFSDRFRQTQWPAGRPLPEVYFDPRSLDADQSRRTSLHAKCVVVDDQDVFISSANFTEAAQRRNIELGVVFRSGATAVSIREYFDGMLRSGLLASLL